MWDEAGRLAEWLSEVPLEAQLLKLSEEVGEVAEAYLGMSGLNPRKGFSHTRDDLAGEVADVLITAAVTLVEVTGGLQQAQETFQAHLAAVLPRTGLAGTAAPAHPADDS